MTGSIIEDLWKMNTILSALKGGRLGEIEEMIHKKKCSLSEELLSFFHSVRKVWSECVQTQLKTGDDPFSKKHFVQVIDYMDERLVEKKLYKETTMRELFLNAKEETDSLPNDDGEHKYKILFGKLLLFFMGIDETFNNSSED